MSRVLMTWNRPRHISDAQAREWITSEVECLADALEIESIALTRVSATPGRPGSWDWVCELELPNDADALTLLRHPALTGWLHELRILGMRPSMALLEVTQAILPSPRRQPPERGSRAQAL